MPEVIIQQETALPVFIGYTKTNRQGRKSLLYQPIAITSVLEYEQFFGGSSSAKLIINLDRDNQLIGEAEVQQSGFALYNTIKLYFANGGHKCYVISAGSYPDSVKLAATGLHQMTAALAAAAQVDEITLVALPDAGLLSVHDYYAVLQAALEQCATQKDRFAILDVLHPLGAPVDYLGAVKAFRAGIGFNHLSFGAAYLPWLVTDFTPFVDERDPSVLNIVGGNLPAGVVLDKGTSKGTGTSLYHTHFELYYAILASITKVRVVLPPCGAVAGIYVRVDQDRGVWKAPANVHLSKVKVPAVLINDQENEDLNVDAQEGKSINAIRLFSGKGILIWGARTLSGNDPERKYIPVRRLLITVEESINKGIDWVVFEPNNTDTWARVKSMIENYLLMLWRQGALQGTKTNEAFYVQVGLGLTMTQNDILQGRMIVEIGLAVIRRAEFIKLKIEKQMQAV